MSEEFDVEPVPGLPHALPPGEDLLWQGAPSWKGLARNTFRVGWLAAYFGVFIVARGVFAVADGSSVGDAFLSALAPLPLAALCLGLLTLLAWLNARATVYSITSRRVVMRFGVALPMTFNLPFRQVVSADLKTRADGQGDISLQLKGPDRIAWLHLWPHARPWRFAPAQPMLRSLPEAAKVAALLAAAVQTWASREAGPTVITPANAASHGTADRPSPAVSLQPGLTAGAGQQA